jgi:hypothetical protein
MCAEGISGDAASAAENAQQMNSLASLPQIQPPDFGSVLDDGSDTKATNAAPPVPATGGATAPQPIAA